MDSLESERVRLVSAIKDRDEIIVELEEQFEKRTAMMQEQIDELRSMLFYLSNGGIC